MAFFDMVFSTGCKVFVPNTAICEDMIDIVAEEHKVRSVRAVNIKKSSLGVKPATSAVKKKCRQLHKPAGGIKPPMSHQGGWKPTLKREISLNFLSTVKAAVSIRVSSQSGPEGLVAPNGSRATSSNAINELGGSYLTINDFCWIIQKIQYHLGLLNNLASKLVPVLLQSTSSPEIKDPAPVLSTSQKFNASSPTDVMKHHLQEDVPVFPANQINPAK
ncbi:hypothetical protein DSO57_1015514 [Entomophthora muscae]|uniref:Uncharacterized protein n=1 Tax=Entomophthora muscae TaxID=34485 RepID=A0ACC2UQY0_9FUNG|nr:hypothetical protein DSO57_1015514 [Entomophthora muscae]